MFTLVIFICTFVMFNLDLPVYTFSKKCEEKSDLSLGDVTSTIIINTKTTKKVNEDLARFFKYINDETVDENDALIKTIHEKVEKYNVGKWRSIIMTLDEKIKLEKQYSHEEGREDTLKEQISKKLKKGKSIPQIADEVETTEAEVERLITAMNQTK